LLREAGPAWAWLAQQQTASSSISSMSSARIEVSDDVDVESEPK